MKDTDNTPLAQLLRRSDVWQGYANRGASHDDQQRWDTGHPPLNLALRNQGWPLGQLIEVCQPQNPYGEWLLWGPALARCSQQKHITVLLNPPATPLLAGLEALDLDPTYLWIIQAGARNDFLPTLQELINAHCVSAVLAWEPKRACSYSELRKLQLCCSQSTLACCLFRTLQQRKHSSPAALRLAVQLQAQSMAVDIFKQKGHLHAGMIDLPLPDQWCQQWQKSSAQTAKSSRILAFPVTQQHR